MPYFITQESAECAGWATVKEDGEVMGCHETKQAAIDQMVALSIAEDIEPGGERNGGVDSAIVVDIDGTLLTFRGAAIRNVVEFVDQYSGKVIIITARVEDDRQATIVELESANVDWDQLFMKPSADTDSMAFKSETVTNLSRVYNIDLAIEDDDNIRAEYTRIGIPTLKPELVNVQELSNILRRSLRALPENYRLALEDDVPEGRACGNCLFYNEEKREDDSAWCERWEDWVRGDHYCNAWQGEERAAAIMTRDDAPNICIASATMFHMENGVESRRINVQDLEVRDTEAGEGMGFTGYAAVFNAWSEPLPFRERIAPGAFARSLDSRNEIKMFVNHDTSRVLASKRAGTLRLVEDSYGLRAEADLPDTTDGRDMATLIRRGDVDSMSFGFSVPQGGDSWSDDGQERELREIRLHEISVVTGFPAYPQTAASVRSLDGLVDATGIEAERLNAAISALEAGETLDEDLAGVLDAAVTKLRAERDDVKAALAMKQKQLDMLLARV